MLSLRRPTVATDDYKSKTMFIIMADFSKLLLAKCNELF